MLWTLTLALLLLPLTLVSATLEAEQAQLIKLASAGNGVIKLDESTFNLLTHPKRTWSAAVQFTAMDKRRRCSPCKCVPIFKHPILHHTCSSHNLENSGLHGIRWQRLGPGLPQSTETPTFLPLLTSTALNLYSRG